MTDSTGISSIGEAVEAAIQNSNGLVLKPTPPTMKFVGFKFHAVPEGKVVVDIRGPSVIVKDTDNSGRPRSRVKFIGWQSGMSIIAHSEVPLGAEPQEIFKAAQVHHWVMSPGRLVHLKHNADGSPKVFNGIKLNSSVGFVLPQILPAARVNMYCPCGKTSFFTWNVMLSRSRQLAEKGKEIYEDLPRLNCSCGMKLNAKYVQAPRLVGGNDASYTNEAHADLQGFVQGYHQDPPTMGMAWPRLWAVYDAHQTPDVWTPSDDLAVEIQARYNALGKAIRPLESMVASAGRPAPKSFVMEAQANMTYGWLTEEETMKSISSTEVDYRKSLVSRPRLEREHARNDADVGVFDPTV